ncbi:uncharacterized protein RAG0_17575 [Rhynchosporium agropyri]|uniref:Uncharacterized protein n=1 Tax=Rhynchosporium agropyri TaxID=914238 RepID=A0A1E1LTW8_9HELO|nr:uncharacterized protein RAG0_17575 [Rhynchosporium agropyri]
MKFTAFLAAITMAFFARSAIASPVEHASDSKAHKGKWDLTFPNNDLNCALRNKCCYPSRAACIRQWGHGNNFLSQFCDKESSDWHFCPKWVQKKCAADCCRTDNGFGRNCPPHWAESSQNALESAP